MIDTRSEHGFRFHSSIPEVVEEGSRPEDDPHSELIMKHELSPNSLYDPYASQSHHHNESTSTSASESSNSSPTTTLSLADDSSVTEMSPGSSPESPMAKPPRTSTDHGPNQFTAPSDEQSQSPPQASAFFDLHRPPRRQGKNLKNLAVMTTGPASTARGAATSLPAAPSSLRDPINPPPVPATSFNRPSSPPKRRPSALALSIVTPANTGSFPSVPSAIVPPTPALGRSNKLRHFQSSPALPLGPAQQELKSAPALPSLIRPSLGRTQSSPVRAEHEDANYDLPQSREEKPEAYPNGPICIFEPNVDLFLEPTAEQAAKYDVVINVASEVRNPFQQYSTPDPTKDNIRIDGGGGIQIPPVTRARNVSEASDATIIGNGAETSTPTTPEATPENDTFTPSLTTDHKGPEYIHMQWEHNTDIVPDLPRLVRLIDDRVKRGKRVLIHCQCGVSRSATLCVAYSMYLNPRTSVQQAYDAVKNKSKWIGPNMNLIMQLQEFSTNLAVGTVRRGNGLRSLTPVESSGSWNTWRRSEPGTSTRLDHNMPKTAPLPPQGVSTTDSVIDNANLAITPGPSSAPSGINWSSSTSESLPIDRKDVRASSVPSEIETPVDSTGRRRSSEKKRPQSLRFETTLVAPILEAVPPLLSPRGEQFAMSRLQPAAEIAAEDHFGIMSPTTSAFSHAPLDRDALLSSLGMGSAMQDTSRRRTQNFSFPFRKSFIAPTALEVATGTFNVARPAQQSTQTRQTLVVPSLTVDSLLDPLLSPRAAAFTVNPFTAKSPSGSASLTEDDPRSPAQKGSMPVVRNIADML